MEMGRRDGSEGGDKWITTQPSIRNIPSLHPTRPSESRDVLLLLHVGPPNRPLKNLPTSVGWTLALSSHNWARLLIFTLTVEKHISNSSLSALTSPIFPPIISFSFFLFLFVLNTKFNFLIIIKIKF